MVAQPQAAPSGERDSETESAQERLEQVRGRIDSLRSRLDSERVEHDVLQTELRRIETHMGELSRQLKELENALQGHLRRLEREQGRKRRLEEDLELHTQALARQVRAAYFMGRQEYLKMLLNQEDPAVVGRVLAYYGYLNRARMTRISGIRATVAQIEEATQRIRQETELVDATRTRIGADRQALQERHDERAAVLAKLERQIDSEEQRLKRYEEDAKRLELLVSQLQTAAVEAAARASDRRQPFANLQGSLPWPAEGRLTARFGSRRETGQLRLQGVVIRAREGAAVHAVSHGRVAFADWLRGFGLLLIIDHGEGYMSLYGHNESLFKQAGDWVEAGEMVAAVGRSGGHRQPGLYFEIRRDGRPTDPGRWFVAKGNQ